MDMIWYSTVWRKRSLPEIRSNEERKGFSVVAENPFLLALCQVLGCDSLNHAPLLDLELFLYLIYFTMILGMANKPSSAHLKIN